MRIAHFEIANFRKLLSVRIDLAQDTTLFVGANNSGKTSAMLALRQFLISDQTFTTNDFTISHWGSINHIGLLWEQQREATPSPDNISQDLITLLPFLDVWLNVNNNELHFVSRLIPHLDWNGGLLGVRLRLEPKDIETLRKDFLSARADVTNTTAKELREAEESTPIRLWPEDLIAFMGRHFDQYFTIRTYILDPEKLQDPRSGHARPQQLQIESESVEGNPLLDLIRVNEINAQRGFGQSSEISNSDDTNKSDGKRKLSDQLRQYYTKHLDPFDKPGEADLNALRTIEFAQDAFDKRLAECFKVALEEVESLGYPGVSDPKVKISTRIRPIDGLQHESAVQYQIDFVADDLSTSRPHLPENYNGLGYQNLISMIFRLMAFRDSWMRVGKASRSNAQTKPLHLVLIEEPEAHLHVQVQQVFIKRAFGILRSHPNLKNNTALTTQLVVSTHSSHVAHETSFANLRYFRRLPAGLAGKVPVSTVINLSEVFGSNEDTQRFVTRYLKTQHSDLFFADAAIIVEGPAERILLPHFIRNNYEYLDQCYISVLEIGGSHAHRLEPLIQCLGLTTLVITDLDAVNSSSRKADVPALGLGQVTGNPTLKQWLPRIESIEILLSASASTRTFKLDELAAVRVAYQQPTSFEFRNKIDTINPSTFEDALVIENLVFFLTLEGDGLANKFRNAIVNCADHRTLAATLFSDLRNGKKAEFALDVLDGKNFEALVIPQYIAGGLEWLQGMLKKKDYERMEAPAVEAEGLAR